MLESEQQVDMLIVIEDFCDEHPLIKRESRGRRDDYIDIEFKGRYLRIVVEDHGDAQ